MSKLILKEIIWEVTNQCNKHCTYCGSKDIINQPITEENLYSIIDTILNRIQVYGKSLDINLSGGEPSTLSEEKMNYIISTLKSADCRVKIITNGELFKRYSLDTINRFDVIGLSINTEEDIDNLNKIVYQTTTSITMITNFGKHNIWLFNKLYDTYRRTFQFKNYWQIQLTEGENLLPPDGINYLYEQIDKVKKEGANLVCGDNLYPNIECSAGIASCGITYNGIMIPCLSMRSWCNKKYLNDLYLSREDDGDNNTKSLTNTKTYSLLDHDIDTIWTSGFRETRFSESCPNCKSSIEYPNNLPEPEDTNQKIKPPIIVKNNPDPWYVRKPVVSLYAVTNPKTPNILVYGVQSPDYDKYDNKVISVYAVRGPSPTVSVYGVFKSNNNYTFTSNMDSYTKEEEERDNNNLTD